MVKLFQYTGLRFIVGGTTSAILNFSTLYLFHYILGVYYIYASIVAFVVGFTTSMILHKFWTFRDSSMENIRNQIFWYFLTSIFGLVFNTFILFILVDVFIINVLLGQAIAGIIVACFTFFISKYFVFNRKSEKEIKDTRILFITQKIDLDDQVLGFIHGWLAEISKKVKSIDAVCLFRGRYSLPENVKTFSLGKENGNNLFNKIYLFFYYSIILLPKYDVVFVHMNQEYVVLMGWLWRLCGKKVVFWRNHIHGDIFTRIAVLFSNNVLYVSKDSFTAKYKKSINMPAGIDTNIFNKDVGEKYIYKKGSILFLGRISPIKNIQLVIDAVNDDKISSTVNLNIVGPVLDREYYDYLKNYIKEKNINNVTFEKGVSFLETPKYYRQHEIYINTTASGSFDKTVFEALSCHAKVLVMNNSMKDFLPTCSVVDNDTKMLSSAIESMLSMNDVKKEEYIIEADMYAKKQSLGNLVVNLCDIFVK